MSPARKPALAHQVAMVTVRLYFFSSHDFFSTLELHDIVNFSSDILTCLSQKILQFFLRDSKMVVTESFHQQWGVQLINGLILTCAKVLMLI